jgi:hypothetical protein
MYALGVTCIIRTVGHLFHVMNHSSTIFVYLFTLPATFFLFPPFYIFLVVVYLLSPASCAECEERA